MKISMYVLLLTVVLFASCRKTNALIGPPPPPSTLGMYVVNEGGFSGGGALSYYDTELDSIFNNVVGPAQSWVFPNDMKIVHSKGYVTVNGLDRIDVIDVSINQVIHSIVFPQYTGPGFLATGTVTVSGAELYTANYNGTVSTIDGSIDSLRSTSPAVVGFTGGIAYSGGKVFISDIGLYPTAGTLVKVLSATTGAVIDSVTVNNAPGALAVINGKVFVVCTGTSKIYQINTGTDALEDSIQLSGYYSDMTTDGQSLYVLSSDSVTKVAPGPLRVVQSSVVKRTNGIYFYSLAVDETNGDIHVSNIISSGGSGEVEIYSAAGVLKRQPLSVGVFPGAFAFKR